MIAHFSLTFQSTPPTRGATRLLLWHFAPKEISIHAPHTGSDNRVGACGDHALDFNPRPPHGERRRPAGKLKSKIKFQSTPPTRGATFIDVKLWYGLRISIHAPHTGSDEKDLLICKSLVISIHAPHTGSDNRPILSMDNLCIFQSTPPTRGATPPPYCKCPPPKFQSTPPTRGATSCKVHTTSG